MDGPSGERHGYCALHEPARRLRPCLVVRPWVEVWGWSSVFFFFAVNGVLYFIVACFIPETKGKSLEEL